MREKERERKEGRAWSCNDKGDRLNWVRWRREQSWAKWRSSLPATMTLPPRPAPVPLSRPLSRSRRQRMWDVSTCNGVRLFQPVISPCRRHPVVTITILSPHAPLPFPLVPSHCVSEACRVRSGMSTTLPTRCSITKI